ncbi:hypothetical protein [Neisseria lactamica]|uniref:hypothetical protein n=1 Tax=Neisseria lactamica TaxID=486 RepID=UPI0013043085|nr:hypothetical protein [Neisseria lactamica]
MPSENGKSVVIGVIWWAEAHPTARRTACLKACLKARSATCTLHIFTVHPAPEKSA